jgi:hypothetical protein
MKLWVLPITLGAVVTAVCGLCVGAAQAEVVPFTMLDVALFTGAPPAAIVATTGQPIPGGAPPQSPSEFNLSELYFDIDGDLENDFRLRTATYQGGQIVFDGFNHGAAGVGSYVVTKNLNSFLNQPFDFGDLIGDEVDEYVRDDNGDSLFSVAVDEAGATRFFTDGLEQFVGIKLEGGFYGWIRTSYDSTAGEGVGALTLLDGAYDNSGLPIAAGSLEPGPADANFDDDADVDGTDFLAWQAGFGAIGMGTPATGDANFDTNVNAVDFKIWKMQFGPVPQSAAVPEPSATALAAAIAVAIAVTRQRRRESPA